MKCWYRTLSSFLLEIVDIRRRDDYEELFWFWKRIKAQNQFCRLEKDEHGTMEKIGERQFAHWTHDKHMQIRNIKNFYVKSQRENHKKFELSFMMCLAKSINTFCNWVTKKASTVIKTYHDSVCGGNKKYSSLWWDKTQRWLQRICSWEKTAPYSYRG